MNKQWAEGIQPLGCTTSSQMSASNNLHGDRNMNICKMHYNYTYHQKCYSLRCELCTLNLWNKINLINLI